MNRFVWCASRAVALLLVAAGLLGQSAITAGETALDRYVKKPDATYQWKVLQEIKGSGVTQYIVHLKSQTWRTEQEVNRTVWEHWLTIAKPDEVKSPTAFMLIGGGANDGKAPDKVAANLVMIAAATKSVTAELKMVPNQALIFHGDGQQRKEDDLIGYTWDQYLKTGDETWPARLPMVKSVVRAMDCIQELMASDQGGKTKVEKFVVAGGSKRGWTTWCTAAVDKRVEAIVPIVIDVLNVNESMKNHTKAYGFFSLAVGDYMRHNIMQRMNEPRLKELYDIEDPYSYRDRLTMPKYIVNAAGDQFFCPDSSKFYFDELKGEKTLRYVPNGDHSLRDTDAWESISSFYQSVLAKSERPKFTWTFESDGSIRVKTQGQPAKVTVWAANNPEARDFRLAKIGKAYKPTVLESQGEGIYVGKIDAPAKGWTAFFVELTYKNGGVFPLKATTAVRVLPETYPFQDIDPATAPLETLPKNK